jgi:hypothetical protein
MHCAIPCQFIPSLVAGASHGIGEKRSLTDAVLLIRVPCRPAIEPA